MTENHLFCYLWKVAPDEEWIPLDSYPKKVEQYDDEQVIIAWW